MKIVFDTVKTPDDVQQILDLQAQNHVSNIDASVAKAQGFVTVKHEPEVLQQMNVAAPSIIARAGTALAGYALVMPRDFASVVPILQPMFDLLDTLSWRGRPLHGNERWFVMGQICVAEAYRGTGVFDGLYQKMREVCVDDYDFVITEIAERNTRSIRAHERVGFETLHNFSDEVADWRVVVLGL